MSIEGSTLSKRRFRTLAREVADQICRHNGVGSRQSEADGVITVQLGGYTIVCLSYQSSGISVFYGLDADNPDSDDLEAVHRHLGSVEKVFNDAFNLVTRRRAGLRVGAPYCCPAHSGADSLLPLDRQSNFEPVQPRTAQPDCIM
jgi:hypothetical protein